MNNIIFEKELKEKILIALEKIYKTVSITLGPKGKNVIISKDDASPFITNDGVTIANAIKLEDEIENIVVSLVKEAANKTNENSSDGTTTSIIMTYELYKEYLNYISKGITEKQITDEIKETENKILKLIENKSIKQIDLQKIFDIAKISSSNPLVASLIKKAYSIDKQINILLEDSINSQTTLEIINGMKLDIGFENYLLIEENKNEIIINNPKIKVFNEIIYDFNDIDKKYDIIICSDYSESIINELIEYNHKTKEKIYIIKAPYHGEKKEEILKDIEYFIVEKNIQKIIIKKTQTILYSDSGHSNKLEERIKYLKEREEKEEFEFEKEIIRNRISNLKGIIAIIKVGAPTELEKIEKKMKIEDAIYSIQKTLNDGICIGGGLTFYNISKELETISVADEILKKVLTKPLKKLLLTSDYNFDDIKDKLKNNIGVNIETNQIENLYDSGVFDSTKTLKEIIKNSISISIMLLNASSLVINNNNNQKINLDNIL